MIPINAPTSLRIDRMAVMEFQELSDVRRTTEVAAEATCETLPLTNALVNNVKQLVKTNPLRERRTRKMGCENDLSQLDDVRRQQQDHHQTHSHSLAFLDLVAGLGSRRLPLRARGSAETADHFVDRVLTELVLSTEELQSRLPAFLSALFTRSSASAVRDWQKAKDFEPPQFKITLVILLSNDVDFFSVGVIATLEDDAPLGLNTADNPRSRTQCSQMAGLPRTCPTSRSAWGFASITRGFLNVEFQLTSNQNRSGGDVASNQVEPMKALLLQFSFSNESSRPWAST